MKTSLQNIRGLSGAILMAALCIGIALPQTSFAKGGTTDPIPGTSKSGVNSGGTNSGGGGKSSGTVTTTNPTPTPAPQPIVSATLNFTAAAQVNGTIPVCSGSYRIDPYYPTLSLMTVSVQCTSMNVPDGTPLYVTVNGTGGTLYPFTSNIISITAQAGACNYSVYVTPGTTITSVVISDEFGTVISAGN